ncbi:MAG: hypothetical protein U9Q19_11825 [Pseudomonadota bacterium]|nr:hypothetical protein [Pseudomonadota bacterium]
MPPDISRNGEVITSLVNRSGKRAYRAYIRVEDPFEGPVAIRGECSCSRRGNCEHVAAVLLRALGHEQELTGDAPFRSLPETAKALATDDVYPADVQQRLLYLLFPDAEKGYGITVETASVRLLKSGVFGSRRTYQPGWVARGMPPRFLLSIDLELLADLGALAVDSITGMRRLHGSAGDDLLASMLETGRCLLGDTESMLRRGRGRHCTLAWGIDATGNQYPEIRPEPATPFVFQLGSPWYIDSASGECGKLETDLPGKLLDEMFQPVRIAPGYGEHFHAALTRRYPGVALPLLRELKVEESPPLQPVPCLRFCSMAIEYPCEGKGARSCLLPFFLLPENGKTRALRTKAHPHEQLRLEIRLSNLVGCSVNTADHSRRSPDETTDAIELPGKACHPRHCPRDFRS